MFNLRNIKISAFSGVVSPRGFVFVFTSFSKWRPWENKGEAGGLIFSILNIDIVFNNCSAGQDMSL